MRHRARGGNWKRKWLAGGLAVLVCASVLSGCGSSEAAPEKSGDVTLGYEMEGVTIVDQASAQAAYDKMRKPENDRQIALYYKNEGISNNGTDFTCFLGNSGANLYDAYFTICPDGSGSEILYNSKLIRPGNVLQAFTLNRELEVGSHTLYVTQTMVNSDKEITNQISFTLDVVVREEE